MKQLRENGYAANTGLNAMGAEVLNSTFVLLFGINAKLNICASNPPLRQAQKRVCLEQPIKIG
jgi:hypothetical protein